MGLPEEDLDDLLEKIDRVTIQHSCCLPLTPYRLKD